MPDVLIAVPPFLNPTGPALGAELVAAACRARDLECEVVYANLDFAAAVGEDVYRRVMVARDWHLVGEAVFAPEVFPDLPDPVEYLFSGEDEDPLRPWHQGRADRACYDACRSAARDFVDQTASALLARGPRVIGFSDLCQQTLASLAVAAAVKDREPDVLTVLGGPSASPPMGRALADVAPMLDCVVGGEADLVFPRLCLDHLRRGVRPERVVECGHLADLDDAQVPDLTGYLEQRRHHQAGADRSDQHPSHLMFESSRGCWWGDTHRCRFCGMVEAPYRRKSDARVGAELRALSRDHPGVSVWASDNVMPKGLPRDVLQPLVREGVHLDAQYEIKADLSEEELGTLARFGATWVQPGIESLCPSVLRGFRKGVAASQHLRLLRDCRSLSLAVAWNFLYRVPGDSLREYEEVLDLLPALAHLHPPVSFGGVTLTRGSPYFADPKRFGIRDVRPLDVYRYLYPSGTRFEDIGPAFQATWPTALDDGPHLQRRLDEALSAWMRLWRRPEGRPALYGVALPGGRLFVHDSRPCSAEPAFLGDARHAGALSFLDTPRKDHELVGLTEGILTELLDRRYAVRWDGRTISLVTRAPSARTTTTPKGVRR